MARQAYLYSTSLVLRWMIRLNIGVLLFLFAASPIVVPIFFNIAKAAGNTYYVDCNAADDTKDGLSPANAWKTINKVNISSFSAGDSILFNRGCTWREQLTVPSSGSVGNVITFGAYGSGTNPILTPSQLVTGWSLDSGSIYKASYATTMYSTWEDNTYLVKVGSTGAMSAGTCYIDTTNHLLYVWTFDGSDPTGHVMEAADQGAVGISLTGISYVTFQDLILEKNAYTT